MKQRTLGSDFDATTNDTIVEHLTAIPNGQWGHVLRNATRHTDWNRPDALQRFISRLNTTQPTQPTPTTTGPSHHRPPMNPTR